MSIHELSQAVATRPVRRMPKYHKPSVAPKAVAFTVIGLAIMTIIVIALVQYDRNPPETAPETLQNAPMEQAAPKVDETVDTHQDGPDRSRNDMDNVKFFGVGGNDK